MNTDSGNRPKVFTLRQNGCSHKTRTGVHFKSESVFTLGQNTHEGIRHSLADVQHIKTATALVWYLEAPANFPLQCYVLLGDLVAQRFPYATTIISGLDASSAGWLKLTLIATGMSKLKTVE